MASERSLNLETILYHKFTHPNLLVPVYIAAHQIFSFYWSEGNKATHVMGPGGAIIPVAENPEEVLNKITSNNVKKETK